MSPEARRFLESLFAGKSDELFVLLWTLPEKQSHWFQDIENAIQFAESRHDRDLYVGVGLSGKNCGASRRCLSDEVAGIVGLWADLDLKSDAHPKAALPATVEDALKILPAEFPPTFVIGTGNGAHAWWLFREPLIFESDEELESQAAPILKSIDRERRPPDHDELDILLHFMAYQWVRVPRFRPFALEILDRLARQKLAAELQSPETWLAALKKTGTDPDAPGADYEGMKRFFESGEFNLTAETDWYMQRAFKDADGVIASLRERYWGTSFTANGRFIASDNPVVLDGPKGQMVGFKNAEVVLYPVSRHVFLTGTLERVRQPAFNFNYFASLNTMMLLGADAQVYSHLSDFSWLDEKRKHQTDWRLFSKERF